MPFAIRYLFLVFFVSSVSVGYGQFNASFGLDNAIIKTDQSYLYNLSVYNENETSSLYLVQSELSPTSQGVMIRSFGGQFRNPKKFILGYSLEIGYNYFSSDSHLTFKSSSTSYSDSIVRNLDGFEFVTNYHALRVNHFLDFHWNPTDNIKITNSIGFGVNAIVKWGAKSVRFPSSIVSTNYPILKCVYQPQITEKYERFSLTFFAAVDLFAVPFFIPKTLPGSPASSRISFANIQFNSIGLRFTPNYKEKASVRQDEF